MSDHDLLIALIVVIAVTGISHEIRHADPDVALPRWLVWPLAWVVVVGELLGLVALGGALVWGAVWGLQRLLA